MGLSWKQFGKLGLSIVGALIPGIAQVEAIARALGTLHGQAKQDAVVALVKQTLELAEGLSDKDLLNDEEVEAATRGVVDAVVHLNNVIEQRRAQHSLV